MSLQAIVDKIQSDAKAQADALRATALEQAQVIADAAQTAVAAAEQAAETALEKEQAHRRAVRLSLAAQAANQRQSAAKRELVDAVLHDAYREICNESSEAYVSRFSALARQCDIDPTEVRTIYTAAERTREASDIAAALGWAAPIESDASLAGGLRVAGDNVAYDLSLAGLFAERRPELEIAVAERLFAE